MGFRAVFVAMQKLKRKTATMAGSSITMEKMDDHHNCTDWDWNELCEELKFPLHFTRKSPQCSLTVSYAIFGMAEEKKTNNTKASSEHVRFVLWGKLNRQCCKFFYYIFAHFVRSTVCMTQRHPPTTTMWELRRTETRQQQKNGANLLWGDNKRIHYVSEQRARSERGKTMEKKRIRAIEKTIAVFLAHFLHLRRFYFCRTKWAWIDEQWPEICVRNDIDAKKRNERRRKKI